MTVPALRGLESFGCKPLFNPAQAVLHAFSLVLDVPPVMPAGRKEVEMDIAMTGKSLQIFKKEPWHDMQAEDGYPAR